MRKKSLVQYALLTAVSLTLGCQEQPAPMQPPALIPSHASTVLAEGLDRINVSLKLRETEPDEFRTQALSDEVQFVAIVVQDVDAKELARTNLIPVSAGQARTSMDVPRGDNLRVVQVRLFDAERQQIGVQMKGYYRSPQAAGDPLNVKINWKTTPVSNTLEKLHAQNKELARSISEQQLQQLVDNFVGTSKHPLSLDSEALTQSIRNLNRLPENISGEFYKPAVLKLKVSGMQAEKLTFRIPFFAKTQQIASDGSFLFELPPGQWGLDLALPESYFGTLPLQKVQLTHGETKELAMALAPAQALDNGVNLQNISKLIKPAATVNSGAPALKMPEAGKVTSVPSNLQKPLVLSWDKGSNDIFNVVLVFPDGRKYNFVTEQNSWQPSAQVWKTMLSANPDSVFHTLAEGNSANSVDIKVSVKGANKSDLDDGNASNDTVRDALVETTLRVHNLPSEGDIYYWSTANGGNVVKVPADGSQAPNPYYGAQLGQTCSGCHTLSHNRAVETDPENTKEKKVTICHIPPGNPENAHTIVVSESAVPAHVANHGDTVGPCPGDADRKIVVSQFSGTDKLLILDLASKAKVGEISNGAFSVWSRDNKRLVYSTNTPASGKIKADLRVYNVETKQDAALPGASDPDWNEVMPTWSADNKTIVFARYPSAKSTTHGLPQHTTYASLYSIPAEGGTAQPLEGAVADPASTVRFIYPTFSPDGKWLTFIRREGGTDFVTGNNSFLYAMPAQGGTPIKLADASTGLSDSWPKWSPEGNWIAFSSHRMGGVQVFVTHFDRKSGRADASFLLPGLTGTANHIPEWTHGATP